MHYNRLPPIKDIANISAARIPVCGSPVYGPFFYNMNIKKAWCFFEQSGTFKNEFIKLGIQAVDLDIQNNFGQTDYVIDLFAEIEKAYDNKHSIFDNITSEDLILAFFPCIHFETMAMMYYDMSTLNIQKWDKTKCYKQVIDKIIEREHFFLLIWKLYSLCDVKGLRLIIENPSTQPHYLLSFQNFPKPTIIDKNRMLRGDCFKKPTAYWYVNCKPTYGKTYQNDKEQKTIDKCKSSPKAGLCSEERSMISSDYARNFICDFIIGKKQKNTLLDLFD